MNILVTGANGQLGNCFRRLVNESSDDHYYFADHKTLDITDKEDVKSTVEQFNIDVIINCAAYTNVNGAEVQSDKAFLANTLGPLYLAQTMKEKGGILVHISTDYVYSPYSWWKGTPFTEEEVVNCKQLNINGLSKRYGELAIEKSGCRYLIIRTSWLYSEYGNNFVKKVIELIQDTEERPLKFVDDQIGSPTYAGELAEFINSIIASRDIDKVFQETVNFSDSGVSSWYDFATFIRSKLSEIQKKLFRTIEPCSSEDLDSPNFPQPKRPSFSVMSKKKLNKLFGPVVLNNWRDNVITVLVNILANQENEHIGENNTDRFGQRDEKPSGKHGGSTKVDKDRYYGD